jgi:hypothetical protein
VRYCGSSDSYRDLCIQCEGLMMAGIGESSGHTADHIMMKVTHCKCANKVLADLADPATSGHK